MNIYRDEVPRTGVSRAGLGRGCTLMQWFILFSLRPSWTSSIIVIHRRKWAARGGAGDGGGPPHCSQSLADTLAASTREPRCTSPTLDAFNLGPCVCALRDPRPELARAAVQCSRSECDRRDLRPAAATASAVPVPASRTPEPSTQLTAAITACDRTVSAIDHCMHALNITLRVYFESLAKPLPMDRMYALRRSPSYATAAKGWRFRERIAPTFYVSLRVMERVDKQCRFTARMGCHFARSLTVVGGKSNVMIRKGND